MSEIKLTRSRSAHASAKPTTLRAKPRFVVFPKLKTHISYDCAPRPRPSHLIMGIVADNTHPHMLEQFRNLATQSSGGIT
ncbi:hypothetical protein J6590_011590 [Homalodisca vitripennis]|nr:hypothetical protein J6590_011590 [Homalodisca vitripennis]